jgi:hypothetical protein
VNEIDAPMAEKDEAPNLKLSCGALVIGALSLGFGAFFLKRWLGPN